MRKTAATLAGSLRVALYGSCRLVLASGVKCRRGDEMTESVISKDPRVLGGTPVFSGTRVPVRILLEHLEAGDRIDDFLENYPSVTREQAVGLIELAIEQLTKLGDEAAA